MVVEGDDRRRGEVESRLADNWVLNARAAGSRARSILFSRIVLMLVCCVVLVAVAVGGCEHKLF